MNQQATDVPMGSADFKDRHVSDRERKLDLVPSQRQLSYDPRIRAVADPEPDRIRRRCLQRTTIDRTHAYAAQEKAYRNIAVITSDG